MHVLLIVLGLLLLLFGGGCTLIGLAVAMDDPQSMFSDVGLWLSIWLPLGLAPLVAGYFLFRQGLKIDRRKRAEAKPPEPDKI
jgi:hypothetical protein